MSRIFPYPLLSLSLMLMWIFLVDSFAPRTILFGALLGIFVPFGLTLLEPEKPKIRNPLAIIKLFFVVLQDIIRSNVAVTSIILNPSKKKKLVSGFVRVPISLQSTYALAVLSIIITCTPGTLWVQYDSGRKRLLLHVLDLVDESEWIGLIKNRYEKLLMEIFE